MNHNFYGEIRRSMHTHPDRPALIGRAGWQTFRQLDQQVQRRTAILLESGVRAGQRVGLDMDDAFAHLETLLAIMQVGACSVALGSISSAAELAERRRVFRLDWVLGKHDDQGSTDKAQPRMPGDLAGIDIARQEVARVGADQPALFFPYYGQVDPANGLTLTHGRLRARLRLLPPPPEPDIRLSPAGFGEIGETVRCLGALAAGATVALSSNLKPGHLCNILGVSDLVISEQWARHFCSQSKASADCFPTLQRVSLYGPDSAPGLLYQLNRRGLSCCGFIYEWPETGAIAAASPELLKQHPLSAGIVLPGVVLQIVDPDHQPMPLGATGLIRAQSPGLVEADGTLAGKLGQHFRDGWFYPGQLGRLEDGGLLFVNGREEQLFFADGQWVNPALIEQVLMTYPGVTEAVAFQSMGPAADSPRLVAAVATETDCLKELLAHSRSRLGRWAPASIIQLAAFPPHSNRAATRKLLANLIT